jgi:hypothetical protein
MCDSIEAHSHQDCLWIIYTDIFSHEGVVYHPICKSLPSISINISARTPSTCADGEGSKDLSNPRVGLSSRILVSNVFQVQSI